MFKLKDLIDEKNVVSDKIQKILDANLQVVERVKRKIKNLKKINQNKLVLVVVGTNMMDPIHQMMQ